MVLTYQEALDHLGSRYAVRKAVAEGRLHRQSRGVYSTEERAPAVAAIATKHPGAVLSGATALYLHGLVDTPPERVDVTTKRGGTKIKDPAVRQHFAPQGSLGVGVSAIEVDGADVPIYDRERMLLELMRIRNKMPYDLYREAVQSFRRQADGLDIYKIQDYAEAVPRGEAYLERAMEEVF